MKEIHSTKRKTEKSKSKYENNNKPGEFEKGRIQ